MQNDSENDGLARLREESKGRGRYGFPSRLRSMEITWERGVLGLAAILIVCAVVGAAVVLTTSRAASNGEHQQQRVSSVLAATQTPRRATPTSTPPPTTAPAVFAGPPDRTDCDLIRGTDYRSEAERQYYTSQCVTPQPARNEASTPPNSLPPPSESLPSAPPGPEPTMAASAFGAAEAIAAGSDWISHGGAVAYTTDPGLCTGVLISGRWIVTCRATLAGCSILQKCQVNVTVCVYDNPIAVRPADQC